MLYEIQERLPSSVTVALGNGERESFRLADYVDYYSNLKRIFLAVEDGFDADVMPDPADSSGTRIIFTMTSSARIRIQLR